MMVIDPMVSNNSAPTELDSDGPKKPLKRRESSKRASERLKRNTAKELRSRSKSPSALTRKLSRKKSTSKGDLKDAKKDKKKKKKEASGYNSDASSDATPVVVNGSLPLGSSSTHSESSKKKPKRNRSSKGVKKSSSVSEHMKKNNELSGGSEHTQSTKTSDSTASTRDTSAKDILSKVPKKKEKESEKEMPPKPPPAIGSPRNRTLSFESIHGKSIHKTKTQRTRGNTEGAGKFIATLAPPPPSPQPQNPVFGSPVSAGGRKKSVLLAKREKQEQDRRASLDKKKSEEYIQEVLAVVNSTPKTDRKSIDAPVNDSSEENFVDPDECSSQSSSCSVVSDGSYEQDDLLSQATDRSEDRDPRFSLSNDKDSFGDHSITIDDDHELSPTKVSPRKALLSPNDGLFSPEDSSSREDALSDSLMEAMASSMSALTEVDEEESPMPTKEALARRKVPRKPLLKNIPESGPASGGKVRMIPKRATSDITSLNRMRGSSFEIRLPGQRKTVTRQRSLTFNEKVRVKRLPCQAQVVGGDTSELWFQPQEYDAIKRKTMALIRAVQDDQTGGVTYCTRGLERYFSVDAVQEKRNDGWDSVLDEQEAQRSNQEEFNAERLSWAYSQTTRKSVKEAMERGKLDQDAIARYTKKMRQTLRRTYSNAV